MIGKLLLEVREEGKREREKNQEINNRTFELLAFPLVRWLFYVGQLLICVGRSSWPSGGYFLLSAYQYAQRINTLIQRINTLTQRINAHSM